MDLCAGTVSMAFRLLPAPAQIPFLESNPVLLLTISWTTVIAVVSLPRAPQKSRPEGNFRASRIYFAFSQWAAAFRAILIP